MTTSRDTIEELKQWATLIGVVAVLMFFAATCTSCATPAKQKIRGGHKTLEYEPSYQFVVPGGETATLPDGTEIPAGTRVTVQGGKRANAVGPSVDVSGDEVNAEYDGSPGDLSLNGGSALGGEGGIHAAAFGGGGLINPFTACGAILILGTGVLLYMRMFREAIYACGTGGVLIGVGVTIETYPWIWLVAVAVVAAVVGYFVWQTVSKDRIGRALDVTVKAVEAAGGQARDEVKNAARKIATQRNDGRIVNDIVAKVKRVP